MSKNNGHKEIFGRVLHLGPQIESEGGVQSVLRSYREFLPAFDCLPTNSPKGTVAGIPVLLWTMLRMPWHRIVNHEKIAHIHSAHGKSFARKTIVMLWASFLGYRTIFHCHGGRIPETFDKIGAKRASAILRRYSSVIALSGKWKSYLETFGCHDVRFIPNIVKPSSRPAKDYSLGTPMTFLFLGRILRQKGIFDMLESIGEHQDDLRGKMTLRIGGDDVNNVLRPEIERLGIGDLVTLLGWVAGDTKQSEIDSCDVMILPSYIEGLPITILEAMAAARGVVTTPVGGIPEIISHGENGFIHQPGDKEGIYQGIKMYLDNPELIAVHGARSLEKVKPYYPENVAKSLQQLYSDILNR